VKKKQTDNESIPGASTSIFLDITLTYKECENNSKFTCNLTGDHENMQYSRFLAKRLFNFCKYITYWSALMVPLFGYGNLTETSALSESQLFFSTNLYHFV